MTASNGWCRSLSPLLFPPNLAHVYCSPSLLSATLSLCCVAPPAVCGFPPIAASPFTPLVALPALCRFSRRLWLSQRCIAFCAACGFLSAASLIALLVASPDRACPHLKPLVAHSPTDLYSFSPRALDTLENTRVPPGPGMLTMPLPRYRSDIRN